ncbi:cellulase family glycosylhydrolase [Robertmurraya kyonggiensis]|uniref:cellulase family glycosylhydrolase n=1 Tax=Robertmurraya kyonggiensis TaxID=1037680 RepID=UPI001FE80D45|nr:cellulase family glycosylhydrolase [Robertmurraya kyonggiensis]
MNIHFTGKQADIDRIRDAGINMVRTDLFWSAIEKEQGVFDFNSFGYDELTSELEKENITPYYVLDYSNTLYEEDGAFIQTEKGFKAFDRYVDEATQRYKNKNIIWEVWNEPNIGLWKPEEYYKLLKETAKTIRANDPSGYIVAPALAGLSEESFVWLEELFRLGALEHMDAISVHPYRSWAPETVAYEYDVLRELVEKYSSKNVPIISGEWGYSTENGWYDLHLSEEEQATYLVRMLLINQLEKIPISIWYGWENDGTDESNFGLIEYDTGNPKLAYQAINAYSYLLADYQLSERIQTNSSDDYVLKFVNDNKEEIFVIWSVGTTHEINFLSKGQVYSLFGKKLYFHDGSTLEIGQQPIYLITK